MDDFRISERISGLLDSDKLPWIIIAVGILLRLIRYLHNPSFWFDESVYAVNIINRSITDFITPSLDYDQGQPLGFLVLVKMAIMLFGNNEYAFRLFPLIFGISSLFLFYRLAQRCLGKKAVLISLSLFAIVDTLVYYSTTQKAYSGDVFFTLLILNIAIDFRSGKSGIFPIVMYSFLGAAAIFISAPSVFVLAGVGTTMILFSAVRKEWPEFRRSLFLSSVWATIFVVYYVQYISGMAANISTGVAQMLKLEGAYMPFPPTSLADLRWFMNLFFEVFNHPAGLYLPGIAALTFIIGCVSMWSHRKEMFFLILSPNLFALFAAAVHEYPFKGRLILFIVPSIFILISSGIENIMDVTRKTSRILWVCILVLLFIHPLTYAAYHTVAPTSISEIKPVLKHIKEKWQPGDVVYVHWYAQYSFEYYSKYYDKPYHFDEADYIIGIAPRGWYNRWKKQDVSRYYDPDKVITQTDTDVFNEYVRDIQKLKGHKRVWLLFTEAIPRDGIREEKFFTYQLDLMGKRLDSFGNSGAICYLYDLAKDDVKAGL